MGVKGIPSGCPVLGDPPAQESELLFYPRLGKRCHLPHILFRADEGFSGETALDFCILETLNSSATGPQQDRVTSTAAARPIFLWINSWRGALLFVTVAATAVISPMFFLGQASGHDIQFHLASWMDVAGQWREGIFYPRWAEWANWGFGEPRFIFYPPASWIAGAALGTLLPWKLVPGALIWLTLVAAGMAMWKLARQWLPFPEAAAAAVFFTVNPYNLIIVYYRSDYAELLAIALLPLLIMYAMRVSGEGSRHIPALAVVFAGIWLSNAPAAVIATYSLPLIFLVECLSQRRVRPVLSGGAAMAGGFGLAAFYILPAAWEQRWVQIEQAVGDNFRPVQNFLFTRSTDADFQKFNWTVSFVAVAVILLTMLAAAISATRRRNFPGIWWTCVTLGAIAALMMVPLSAPVWNHLPKLYFIQFPWRWLSELGLTFAFLAAASMYCSRQRWVKLLIPIIVLSATGAAATRMVRDAWWDSCDAPFIADEISSSHGYEGTDEYSPLGSDRSDLISSDSAYGPTGKIAVAGLHAGEIVPAVGVQVHIERWTAERKIFTVEAPGQTTLALHTIDYPAWAATVDGNAAQIKPAADTAIMLLTLPPGPHRVEVRFQRTWDRDSGNAISVFSAIGLLGFSIMRKRQLPSP